jgi:hypothetical protein
MENHLPDKGWLINILWGFNRHDEILEKAYVPPPSIKKAS